MDAWSRPLREYYRLFVESCIKARAPRICGGQAACEDENGDESQPILHSAADMD